MWSNESAADLDFVEYRLYRSGTPGGPYVFVAATGAQTAFVDSGLTSGSTYYYVVRGAEPLQESANSPEASGTTGAVATPYPTPPPVCNPPAPPDCGNAGDQPDGGFSNVGPGQELILDLGPGNGILDGPGYDLAYFERERPPVSSGVVQMDWVTVELSLDQVTWYPVFAWSLGSESMAASSEIAPFASIPADPNYCDLFDGASNIDEIPMGPCNLWTGLYGTPPLNTGVRIDIALANPPIPPPTGEGYRYIRIRTRSDAPQPAEIDGIARLN